MLEIAQKYFRECREKKQIPYIEDVALACDVDDDTIVEWTNRYPEFSAAIKRIKILQRRLLQHIGFSKQANAAMAIFLLKANHGMKEYDQSPLVAIQNNVVTNLEKLPDDELDRLIESKTRKVGTGVLVAGEAAENGSRPAEVPAPARQAEGSDESVPSGTGVVLGEPGRQD